MGRYISLPRHLSTPFDRFPFPFDMIREIFDRVVMIDLLQLSLVSKGMFKLLLRYCGPSIWRFLNAWLWYWDRKLDPPFRYCLIGNINYLGIAIRNGRLDVIEFLSRRGKEVDMPKTIIEAETNISPGTWKTIDWFMNSAEVDAMPIVYIDDEGTKYIGEMKDVHGIHITRTRCGIDIDTISNVDAVHTVGANGTNYIGRLEDAVKLDIDILPIVEIEGVRYIRWLQWDDICPWANYCRKEPIIKVKRHYVRRIHRCADKHRDTPPYIPDWDRIAIKQAARRQSAVRAIKKVLRMPPYDVPSPSIKKKKVRPPLEKEEECIEKVKPKRRRRKRRSHQKKEKGPFKGTFPHRKKKKVTRRERLRMNTEVQYTIPLSPKECHIVCHGIMGGIMGMIQDIYNSISSSADSPLNALSAWETQRRAMRHRRPSPIKSPPLRYRGRYKHLSR